MHRRKFLKLLGMAGAGFCVHATARGAALKSSASRQRPPSDAWIKDYLHKMHNFDKPHPGDRLVAPDEIPVLKSACLRLFRVQRTVGHGNFHLISFDDAILIARNYSRVGAFPRRELDFLEKLFYEDAAQYGFFGEKPVRELTGRIRRKNVLKIPRTGSYLYRGQPLEIYKKLRRSVGPDAVLTSGIRSVMKQFLLFLNKVCQSHGNLSIASRSLAPPGYSYHGIADFDVGQVGFGADNFTEKFASTKVFRRLTDQGFISLRYGQGNLLGVRFEPWHIKVDAEA